MKKKLYVAGVLVGMLMPLASQAEEPISTMKEVVVTATRTTNTLGTVGGSSVTVITSEDIEAKQHVTVEEMLKEVPGVDIVANGGLGTSTSVFIRGADSKNTLVLVDGVMFNDPAASNRQANLANLTTDNIERIEVVRGPMSVLYGSNATAGVVNIITKKGKGKPSFYVGGESGSYGTWKTYGGASGSVEKFNYALNASRTETQGFSTADDDNDRIPHTNGSTSEKDGWENTTLSGNVGFEVAQNFDIAASIRYMDSRVDTDSSVSGYLQDNDLGSNIDKYTDTEQFFGRLNIHNNLLDGLLDSNLYYQMSDTDREINDDFGRTLYDGKSSEIGWQGSLNIHDNNIATIGASYFEENMDSSGGFSVIRDKTANISSYWLQDQLTLGDAFDVVAGVRLDRHDRFGSETTYRVSPSYFIEKTSTTLKANYGTGFRAPSLFELHDPTSGNASLEAETSYGWDGGIEQDLFDGKARAGVTYFETTFDNLIKWDSIYIQSTGKTKTKGVESFVAFYPMPDLDLKLNYTYTDSSDADGARLVRRPLNKVYFSARYHFLEKATMNMDIQWAGKRDASSFAKDKDGNLVGTLDSYTVVNLAARYTLTDKVEIYGRIDNLFDEEYEEAWSYAVPGLSGYVGLKFTY